MSYDVHLEMFEGPLDLLLYLLKRDDLDVYNIPVAKITHEYLEMLDVMKDLNLELAGEFLLMAATLVQLKAKMLLPPEGGENADEGPDPRMELVNRLVEYQKFKAAAQFLDARASEFRDVHYRGAPDFEESEKNLDIDFFDLLSSLKEILARAEVDSREVMGEEFPIEDKIAKIMGLLEGRECISWEDIFTGERKRGGIVTCFLALLELVKSQKLSVRQEGNFSRIMIYKKAAQAAVGQGAAEPAPGA